jgi:membrane-associated protease RseP (regulator of RpoE activity)
MKSMQQRWIHLVLVAGLASPMAAQEPRQRTPAPVPAPSDRVRERTMMLSPDVEGRIYYFNANRGKMGITVSIRPEASDSIGALVDAVSPGSPAFKAGIQSGDLITRFNGRSVTAIARDARKVSPGLALLEVAAALSAGDTARVEFRRGTSRPRTVAVVLEPVADFLEPSSRTFERTPFGNEPMISQEWSYSAPGMSIFEPGEEHAFFLPFKTVADLELAPMNPGLGQYFGVTSGVLVISAPAGTTLNLKSGDVVVLVDGRRVSSPNQFFRVLRSYEPGEQFRLEIVRMKRKEVVTASIGER